MKNILTTLLCFCLLKGFSQDLIWSTSAIPDNTSALYNFGPTGSPYVNVTFETSGPGTFAAGPARFTTAQGDITWRSQVNFSVSTDLKTFTYTFNQSVCGLSFVLYDIDGNNTNGDRAIITADNSGTPQTITAVDLDPVPPTILGSGTTNVEIIGTQGSQSDNRVQINITGCVTTLTIQYGNNILGTAGTRSYSISNLAWTSVQPSLEDLVWNTTAVPDNATSFNFGSQGSPASTVNYSVTGPGTFDLGPLRYVTAQGTDTWRTRSTFSSVNDLKTYTLTFSPAVCNLSFILYDIDGDNTSGDRAIVTANYVGVLQNVTITTPDANPPTLTESGTATATATGTQGNQDDPRVQVNITGCVSTLTIQYGNNTAGSAGQRSFSIGNLIWDGNTLPVTFISFTGQKKTNGNVELKWVTENESDLLTYEIERSVDGRTYIKAGNVTPQNRNATYTFSDQPVSQATVFYRIKQVDLNGSFKYSNIVAIKMNPSITTGINVFPNPASDAIFITTNNGAVINKVQIYDGNGRMVIQNKSAANRYEISTLPKGIYRIKVIDKNGETSTNTFIKQ